MEKIIKKFQKLVREDKERNVANNDLNDHEESSDEEPKKFVSTQKDPFSKSEIVRRHERNKNKKIMKSFSESQMLPSAKPKRSLSSEKNLQSSLFKPTNISDDPIIATVKENASLSTIVDNLNEILDLYISSLSDLRITTKNLDEKEFVMQNKYEVAEKMMKNYELKYLTSEKEKTKLTKQLTDLNNKFNALAEKNETILQKKEEMIRLEKNNYVLLQTNEDLKKQVNEINLKNDFIKKKYDEEVKEIKSMLMVYKERLEKVENKMTQTVRTTEEKTITLNNTIN